MLDTKAVAQKFADKGIAPDQAEVIADAIGQAVGQGNLVTSDQFTAGLAKVRTEVANTSSQPILSRFVQAWIGIFGLGIAVGGVVVSIATWKNGIDAKFAHLQGAVDALQVVAGQNSGTLNSLVRAVTANPAEVPDPEANSTEVPDPEANSTEVPDPEANSTEVPDPEANSADMWRSRWSPDCYGCHMVMPDLRSPRDVGFVLIPPAVYK